MMVKAVLIPFDTSLPCRTVEHDNADYRRITRLVCADPDHGSFDIHTFDEHNCALAFDDEGLYTQPDNVNPRAIALWAALDEIELRDFAVPLVGDYLVIGPTDDEGNTLDVPDELAKAVLKLNKLATP